MKLEKEFEAKTLVSEHDFYKLIRHYPNALKHSEVQTNYYFDTPNQTFKNHHSALRIRQTENDLVLTAKIKIDNHHQEIHYSLSPAELQQALESKQIKLPENFRNQLSDFGINDSLEDIQIITQFTTKRSEMKLDESILFFDQVTFSGEGHKDYELEVEAPSKEKAEMILKNILEAYEVPYHPSRPKIARALVEHS